MSSLLTKVLLVCTYIIASPTFISNHSVVLGAGVEYTRPSKHESAASLSLPQTDRKVGHIGTENVHQSVILKSGAEYHLPIVRAAAADAAAEVTPAQKQATKASAVVESAKDSGYYVVRPVQYRNEERTVVQETADDFWKAKESRLKRQFLRPLYLPDADDVVGKAADENVSKLRKTLERLQQDRNQRYYDPHHVKDHPDNLDKNIEVLHNQHKQGLFGKKHRKLYIHNAIQRSKAQGLINDGYPVRVQNRIHHSDKVALDEIIKLARKGEMHSLKLLKDKRVRGVERRLKLVAPLQRKESMKKAPAMMDPVVKVAYYKAGPVVYRLPSQRFRRKARSAHSALPLSDIFTPVISSPRTR